MFMHACQKEGFRVCKEGVIHILMYCCAGEGLSDVISVPKIWAYEDIWFLYFTHPLHNSRHLINGPDFGTDVKA